MTNQTKAAPRAGRAPRSTPHAAQPGDGYGQAQFDADVKLVSVGTHTPKPLHRALVELAALVENGSADHFNDCFVNDTQEAVEVCRATFRACRAALDSLEETAREVLAGEVKYRHEKLAEIQGIGTF
jgi:hypothetical protein